MVFLAQYVDEEYSMKGDSPVSEGIDRMRLKTEESRLKHE